jgi:hypothetical protein
MVTGENYLKHEDKRVAPDSFPRRRGKARIGVQEKFKVTPTFVLPRRGGGNKILELI